MNPSIVFDRDRRPESTSYSGKEVRLCTDGKYRWTYPLNMLTNPQIYLTVCKIFGIIGGAAFVVTNMGNVVHGEFATIVGELKYWGIAAAVFFVISILAYFIVAGKYGMKYIVRFTMDEKGIVHDQIPEQKKKAQKMGAALAGSAMLAGNPGGAGQGMMIAGHTSLTSDFSKVKRVKALRRWNTIKVNEPFAKNQIYTTERDFDFVYRYIVSHCPKVK